MEKILNWKLVEVIDQVEIVSTDYQVFKEALWETQNIPIPSYINALHRASTEIEWGKMAQHFKLFYDAYSHKEVEEMFRKTALVKSTKIMIFYGNSNLVVKVPTNLFIKEWEDFIASTYFECMLFSDDFSLIMECSRDYNLHSNFKIEL